MLPFSYALRNLWRHRARTIATLLGVGFVTLLVTTMASFAASLDGVSSSSTEEDRVYLLGTSSEMDLVRSVVARGNAEAAAAAVPGVLTLDGERAVSVELHLATRTEDRIGLLRGVRPGAYLVHPQLTVIEGTEPRGPFEIMVGRLAATRMGLPEDHFRVGRAIQLENRDWKIVGRFAAPGTVLEAEMWTRLDDLMVATKREDVSCVVARLASPESLAEVRLFAARRLDLEIAVVTEPELMATLAEGLRHVTALARWMALLVLAAGAFACANTMFAAVLARTKELATLRALGYSPFAVSVSLLLEAALVAFLGASIGIFIALAVGDIPLRFPMGAFTIELDAPRRALGLGAALFAGILGGVVPAVRAVRLRLVDALGGKA